MPLLLASFVNIVAVPVAKFFLKQAYKESLTTDISTSLVDSIAEVVTGEKKDKDEAERKFHNMGEEVARSLWPLFQNEDGHMDEGELTSVANALAYLINDTVTTNLLLDVNLSASNLESHLKAVRSPQTVGFGDKEKSLYLRAIKEMAPQLVAFAPKLQDFQEKTTAQILSQLDELAALSDALLGAPAVQAARYESRYLAEVRNKLDEMELFGAGLPPGKSRHPLLEVAYISLNLSQENGTNAGVEDVLGEQVRVNGRLLVTGDAGSGKSTLMRWLCLECSRFELGLIEDSTWREGAEGKRPQEWHREKKRPQWRGRIPFLVRLRDCADGLLPEPNAIPLKLEGALGTPPEGWVQNILLEGRGVVIFDGIDEVPSAHRDRLIGEMEGYFRLYDKTPFLLTARPAAVADWEDWLQQQSFKRASINSMSATERLLLINRWHEAVRQTRAKYNAAPAELTDIMGKAEKLSAILANDSRLSRLASYPLLCSVICALHLWKGAEPLKNYWRMCSTFCQLLLHDREVEAQIQLERFPPCYRELDYDVKRAIVQGMAVAMSDPFTSVITFDRAVEITAAILEYVPGRKKSEAAKTLELMLERSGILRGRQQNEVEFIHNIFKEFFIADDLIKKRQFDVLQQKCADPDWEEVIVFAAANNSDWELTNTLVKTLLEVGDHRSRVLALRCRQVSAYLAESLESQLDEIANSVFPPANEEQARAIATLGNTFVQRLRYRDDLQPEQANACVLALGHINTDDARKVAESYVDDPRVVDELVRIINPLLIPSVLAQVATSTDSPQLEWLTQNWRRQITDLSPLRDKNDIQFLYLDGTSVSDLSPLENLTGLQELHLAGTSVSNLKPLENLTSLQKLHLSNTQVSDLEPLKDLKQLQDISLNDTFVEDVAALSFLPQLETLFLSGVSVSDLSPFASLQELRHVSLSNVPSESIELLASLPQLESLSLEGVSVNNLNLLVSLGNLRTLSVYDARGDLTSLVPLSQLENLYLSGTSLEGLESLASLTQLQILYMRGTFVSDVAPLASLTHLRVLYLINTLVKHLIPLAALTELSTLDLSGTPVSDFTPVQHIRGLTIIKPDGSTLQNDS